MFLSDAEIKTALAPVLKQAEGSLAPTWDGIIPRAHRRAYTDITSRLLARGYTQEQVLAWDADTAASFERDLSCYWCLVLGGMFTGFDKETLNALDRRAELSGDAKKGVPAVTLQIGGVYQSPASQPGQAATGSYAESGRFNYGDLDRAGP